MRPRTPSLLAAGLVLAFSAFGFPPASSQEPASLHAERIPLYPSKPADRRAGSLIYRGGLVLDSADQAFGGWSDIAVTADGSEILAISDAGHWLKAHLSYDPNGDLEGVDTAEIAPMLDLEGRPMTARNGDAEGLALERPNDLDGTAVVSFEGNVRVWRYDLSQGFDARPANVPVGPWVYALRNNRQLEAIALIKPDTLLAVAETKLRGEPDILAALEAYPGTDRPMTRMLAVKAHDPFSVTSAANAPDGGVYLLERRFSILGGIGMELRHIAPGEIKAGALLDGEVLANLSFQDANIDNMEGLAVRRGPNGETFLYMISDDNYSPLQRTLLLMFEVKN